MSKETRLPKGIRMKNGSYEARATIKGVCICLHNKDLKQLKQDFEAAKEHVKDSSDYHKTEITLNEWFDEWFDTVKAKKVKPTSIYPMKSRFVRTFGFYLGNKKLKDIKPMDVQNALNAMEAEGKSSSTMRDVLGRLRECMEFALANQLIGYNPCIVIEVPWTDKITNPMERNERNAECCRSRLRKY